MVNDCIKNETTEDANGEPGVGFEVIPDEVKTGDDTALSNLENEQLELICGDLDKWQFNHELDKWVYNSENSGIVSKPLHDVSELEATFDIDQYSTGVPSSMSCAYYGNNVKDSNEVDELTHGMDKYLFNDPLMDVALDWVEGYSI